MFFLIKIYTYFMCEKREIQKEEYMNSALTALFEMIKQFLSTKQTEMEHSSTLEVVKDKKSLKKASNFIEDLLKITDKYTDSFDKKDLKKYNRLKDKFFDNN